MKTRLVLTLFVLTAVFVVIGCTEPEPPTPEEKTLKTVKEEREKAEPETTDEEREAISNIPEEKRKEIYYEIVKYEDSIPLDDPDWFDKVSNSREVIGERYGITEDEATKITAEGIEKSWPMPPPPDHY